MPKEEKNIRYKPGSRSLKVNSVIYADFESILLPYSGCDNKDVKTKKINNHVPCGYSINVVNNHSDQTKQTFYRGEGTVSVFCEELSKIVQDMLNTETKSMEPLSKKRRRGI